MSRNQPLKWIAVLSLAMLMASPAGAACDPPQFLGGSLASTTPGAAEIAVGNLNNDNDVDFLSVSGTVVDVHLRNGIGGFLPVDSYAVTDAEEVTLGDLNHDGFLDIVVSHEPGITEECVSFGSCAGFTVLLNDGDGTFGLPSTIVVPFAADIAAIRIADFNDDGNGDVLVAGNPIQSSDPNVHVLFGNGIDAFPSRRSWAVAGQVRDAVAAKLNAGSTQPDVIVAVSPAMAMDFLKVIVFPSVSGTFPGSSASRNIAETNSEVHLTAADFNDNGLPDIGLTFEHSPGVWGAGVVLTNGNSSLSGLGFYAETSGVLTGVAALDLDEDGDNDIVAATGSNTWKGFLRQGSNFVLPTPARSIPLPDMTAHGTRVVTTDLNRDGRPDMLFLDAAHDMFLYLQNYCARYTKVTLSSSPNPSTLGTNTTFTISVQPKPNAPVPPGTVRLWENGTQLGQTTLNGSGNGFITLSSLSAGSHTLHATYDGEFEFAPQTSANYEHTVALPPFGAPLNVTATGNGAANQITVRWTATSDSASHDVLRRLNGAWQVIAPNVVGETYVDSNVVNTSAYVYAVQSHSTGGATSGISNSDIGTTATLALPSDNRIRASDILTTRSLVDSLRSAAGLPPFNFTDASLTGVKVKAVHVTELRTAVNDARTPLGFPALTFTNPTLTPNVTLIRKVDVQEIRNSFQ